MFILDFNVIGDEEYEELDQIFLALPGWKGTSPEHHLPQWFGNREGSAPWLNASEPIQKLVDLA